MIHVKSLHVYPIKSFKGIALENLEFESMGPRWDRRYMLVDSQGRFQTQRQIKNMHLIKTIIENDELYIGLSGKDNEEHKILIPQPVISTASKRQALIWKDPVTAYVCDESVNKALSDFLGKELELVYIDQNTPRLRTKDTKQFSVSFADVLVMF